MTAKLGRDVRWPRPRKRPRRWRALAISSRIWRRGQSPIAPHGASAPSTRNSPSTRIRLEPVPYEGERGIGALLNALADEYDWKRVKEGGNTIALSQLGRFDHAGARRSVRTFGRAARAPASDLRARPVRTSRNCATSRATWASHSSASASRRSGRSKTLRSCRRARYKIMRDVHGEGRPARAPDDVPLLYGAD